MEQSEEHPNSEASMRKFLHDIATPMSLIRLYARKVEKTIDAAPTAPDPVVIKKVMEQMIGAIEKLELLHAEQKSKIYMEMTRENKS
jgi:hypothetical protein